MNKFLSRFVLFTGLSKSRTNNSKLLEIPDFETNVVTEITCNEHWPLCLYDAGIKLKYALYFAFKQAHAPVIIDDYFE